MCIKFLDRGGLGELLVGKWYEHLGYQVEYHVHPDVNKPNLEIDIKLTMGNTISFVEVKNWGSGKTLYSLNPSQLSQVVLGGNKLNSLIQLSGMSNAQFFVYRHPGRDPVTWDTLTQKTRETIREKLNIDDAVIQTLCNQANGDPRIFAQAVITRLLPNCTIIYMNDVVQALTANESLNQIAPFIQNRIVDELNEVIENLSAE